MTTATTHRPSHTAGDGWRLDRVLHGPTARERRNDPVIGALSDLEGGLWRIRLQRDGVSADVWLLTAPRNPAPGEEAKRIMSAHNRIDFDLLMQVHDDYNDLVRRVGRETGALVVDMDAIYRRHAHEPAFIPTDVAHPSQGGHVLEAEILFGALVTHGLVRPEES